MSFDVFYRAWNVDPLKPKTGDSANHTITVEVDGSDVSATAAEIGEGVYKATLTDAELPKESRFAVRGSSATADVVIIGETGVRPSTKSDLGQAAADAIKPSFGSLPFTASVVDDETDEPIETATVRFTKAGKSGVAFTDDAGEAPSSLELGTWTITVAAAGYGVKAITYTVIGSGESTEIRLDALTIPPAADPDQCNCAVDLINSHGGSVEGAVVSAEPTAEIEYAGGAVMMPCAEPQKTDANGRAVITLVQGVEYKITARYRGGDRTWTRTVPNAPSATLSLEL